VNSDYINYNLDPRITVHIAYSDADPQVFGPQYPITYIFIPKDIDITTSYLDHSNPFEDLKSFLIRMFNKIFRLH
jgi:hypothetical protein